VHISVLLGEAIAGLAIKEDGIYVDATFGRGGHSQVILEKLGPKGRLLAIDLDPEAIAVGKSAPFSLDTRFDIAHASFAQLEALISARGWLGRVDGVLLDLGVSSPQLDAPERGFSFMREGPLDMRMNPHAGVSAEEWINSAEADDIANVLYEYGEEKCSRKIARAIVASRDVERITTTTQLAGIIAAANPLRDRHKHPATRSFQAIRIFVNQELEAIKAVLPQVLKSLAIGGRLCVISFHSLEDRIAKQFIQHEIKGPDYPPHFPAPLHHATLKMIGKAIEPSDAEVKDNSRARSARLRVVERIL
jgi:16S rRNA (cytosine1402-N4)-methyltransferase